MVKLSRILKDYQEAGGVNSLIGLWGFVDDTTFLTKAGHVGQAYRIRGVDAEGMTHAQRADVTHRVEAALRLLDEHCRLYQYVVKQTVEPFVVKPCLQPVANEAIQRRTAFLNSRRDSLYVFELYVVLLYEASTTARTSTRLGELWRSPSTGIGEWLSRGRALSVIEAELDRAITTLHQKAQAFEVQLSDVGPAPLEKYDAFRFFRMLVNYDEDTRRAATLTTDAYLDYFVADSAIECHRDHLTVGNRLVKVLSMKEPPSQTFAHVLGDLNAVPGEFIVCLEWQRLSGDRMRRDLQSRRRHFFNKRVSIVNFVSPETRPEEMLVDDSASATVRQLGDALTELEVNGHFFGECSLTVVLHAEDPRVLQTQSAEATKALAVHDGHFFEETYNLLNAWMAIIPGNAAHNLRRLALLETNLADLSLIFTVDQGELVSPYLGREALAIFETPHQAPYAYNLHVDDVGHTLILGATGSGKSFLLNFLITHAQKYDPLTVVLDLGHSYRKLATLLRGSYLEVGIRQNDFTINPFALEPTPEHLHFLHAFVRVLLEGDDAYQISDLEDREIYEAIENLYVLDRTQRRLFTLANLLPRSLTSRMQKWVEGGRYASLFDHLDDTLTLERLQVFDFEGMRAYPSLLEPLLFYLLHRVTARIHEPHEAGILKLCVMDEAWRFIHHPALRAYVEEALKTWRKRNATMILATQTAEDFASTDLLRTVVEGCPTKLLLANPALDQRRYADLFQLNEMELTLLAGLIPRQQILLKRQDSAKVLTLTIDPKSYWIYTNTPIDNERAATIFREWGFEAGLDRLAASV